MLIQIICSVSVIAIQSLISISLFLTGNQPGQTQQMDGTPIENINMTANLVVTVTMLTSLLSQVTFRCYLLSKMGNQTNELFSNKSVLTMSTIYFITIVSTPIIALYFQRPELTGIAQILGTSLVMLLQILVCHDNAYDFFMARHPKIKDLIDSLKEDCQPVDDEFSTSDGLEDYEAIAIRHLATISEMVDRANEQENTQPPDPLEAWRLVRNSNKQAQFQQLPRLIHVKPAPNSDE